MLDLPAPRSVAGEAPAVEWLVETLRAATAPVTLVSTGPLTNIAAAVAADPGIVASRRTAGRPRRDAPPGRSHAVRRAQRVVRPGGGGGRAGGRLPDVCSIVGMDATFAVPFDADDAATLAARGAPAGTAAARFVTERIELYRSRPGDGGAGRGAAARPAGRRLPAGPRGRLGRAGPVRGRDHRPHDVRRHPVRPGRRGRDTGGRARRGPRALPRRLLEAF